MMSSNDLKISIIIPFSGNLNDLSECLKGIQNQNFSFPFEVIVIESVNDPGIKQIINLNPDIKFISFDSVIYPGKARNLGVKNSNSDLLAFIDADCIPSVNWFSEIYSSLKKEYEIVIGPVINLFPFHPLASIDNLLQFPDFQKYRKSGKITHFPACNLGITRKLFYKTNGFPEDISIGEDVKFSQRAISLCNGRIFYNKKLIVSHGGRKSLKAFTEHNRGLGFYRGYLNLKITSKKSKFRKTTLYAVLFGVKRFFYITFRTAQWNPFSLLRVIFFFPFLILGLSAWVNGFREGNIKFINGEKI